MIKEIRNSITMVAKTNSTVLITGETGTGKELVANIIHYNSSRKDKPLIKVSCAILSKDIFESELFGHVKGAFTGADKDRSGRFEDANGGTIYLDDIDDVPPDLQVKLLRVLQENEIERVGSSKPIKVDARILTSTKKDLKQLVAEGKFREDLYYRLNVWPIYLKPLRERVEDIPILFENFVKKYGGNRDISIEPEVFEILKKYSWAGNTRELKNLAERMVILAQDGLITVKKLPVEYFDDSSNVDSHLIGDKNLSDLLSKFEVNILRNALIKSGGNKTKAADMLGIPFPKFDLSASVSMGRIIPGLAEIGPPNRSFDAMFSRVGTDIAGASFGIGINALKFLSDNQLPFNDAKRWERAMPRAMKNLARGYRFLEEGRERNNNGGTVLKFNASDPEQLAEVVGQALGFTPTRLSRKWDRQRMEQEAVAFWNIRRGKIGRAHV